MSESTLITTPFTARSTAAEVMVGLDLLGRFAVVTGGASPVGIETARALAAAGADVTLAVRDTEAGRRAAEDIIDTTGAREVRIAPLDLTDRASVAAFAAAWQGPLHMLVHNAGVRETPERRTPEGWELQFAVNHLGHLALATGLHGALVLPNVLVGTFGRAPSLVAITISSPTPRARRQRPSSASLSPPWVPSTQNA